jgi:uncharacterized membrane-anchored protein YjiN (DUF445 family)
MFFKPSMQYIRLNPRLAGSIVGSMVGSMVGSIEHIWIREWFIV